MYIYVYTCIYICVLYINVCITQWSMTKLKMTHDVTANPNDKIQKYTYLHVHTQIVYISYIHKYTQIYIYSYMYMCVYIYVYVCIYIYIYICIYIHIYIFIYMHMFTYVCVCTDTFIHIYMHIYVNKSSLRKSLF